MPSNAQNRSDSYIRLRLFNPPPDGEPARSVGVGDDGRAVVSPSMTLGEFFDAYYVPHVLRVGRSPRTLREVRSSLRLWASLTGDPPVGYIDDAVLADFVARLAEPIVRKIGTLRKSVQLAPATIRKHCAQLAPLLRALGPRDRRNRRGAGLVADPVEMDLPPLGDSAPIDAPDLDALDRVFDACRVADVPRLDWIDAPTWWRALIVIDYELALRIGSLIYVDWSWIKADHRGLSLHVPAARYKGRRRSRVFPVNDVAATWFAVLKEAQQRGGVFEGTPHGDRVFRWPHDPHPTNRDPREHNDDLGHLQRTRRKIFAAGGVTFRGGFHALRRAHATLRPLVDLVESQRRLGHERSTTTERHYIGDVVGRAVVDGLPQPTSFLQGGSFHAADC